MSELLTMYKAQANSPYTTTLGEISATDTSVTLANASLLLSEVPFLVTLGYEKMEAETVLVTAVSGNVLTLVRGVEGTSSLWAAGTKIARTLTAKDLNDMQENLRRLNEGKQEKLKFDDTPTVGSENPVTSGGLFTSLNERALSKDFKTHTADTEIHVSAEEKETWNDKQSAITGEEGQYVGFDADGKPSAQDKSTLGFIPSTEKGAANGVASLNSSGTIPTEQIPSLSYIPASQKGTAGGVASLNSSGQIPTAQIPSLSATYMPKSGGTMTGALVAQSNNNWSTAQVRNIVVSTEDLEDGVSTLANGCLWGVYEE